MATVAAEAPGGAAQAAGAVSRATRPTRVRHRLIALIFVVSAIVGGLAGGWQSDLLLRRTGSIDVARKAQLVAGMVLALAIGYPVAATGSFSWALVFVGAHCLVTILAFTVVVGAIRRLELRP